MWTISLKFAVQLTRSSPKTCCLSVCTATESSKKMTGATISLIRDLQTEKTSLETKIATLKQKSETVQEEEAKGCLLEAEQLQKSVILLQARITELRQQHSSQQQNSKSVQPSQLGRRRGSGRKLPTPPSNSPPNFHSVPLSNPHFVPFSTSPSYSSSGSFPANFPSEAPSERPPNAQKSQFVPSLQSAQAITAAEAVTPTLTSAPPFHDDSSQDSDIRSFRKSEETVTLVSPISHPSLFGSASDSPTCSPPVTPVDSPSHSPRPSMDSAQRPSEGELIMNATTKEIEAGDELKISAAEESQALCSS